MLTAPGTFAIFSSAPIAPLNSILLFVVCGDPPPSSVTKSSDVTRMAPQPPGPGLPFAAPSVKTVVRSISLQNDHRRTRGPRRDLHITTINAEHAEIAEIAETQTV